MGNVVDRNDAVEQHNDHKEEKAKGEIVQERIGYHIAFSIPLVDPVITADLPHNSIFDAPPASNRCYGDQRAGLRACLTGNR
jgi:hypothetical protein